ncbi:MAG TPA: right-handed parallel beta-helix repeat-containing protein [Humisphaera sp.]|nr:right-handed parallel beta-helix repeat-containing protein [Humisphaera sp.]
MKAGRVAKRKSRCNAACVEAIEGRVLLSTSWYVAGSGNDANPGTLALPFKTIQHAANLAGAGDTVFIRGGTYRETVTPAHSGVAGAPITFSAYNNEVVTVSGADPITGWSSAGGSTYTATQAWDLGEGNNQIFVDGQMMNEARWPNPSGDISKPATSVFKSVTATNTSATITDPALTQAANFWKGTYIQFGAGQAWFIQTGTVTASGPGWLTFSYTRSTGFGNYDIPTAGNRYFLFNNPALLDAPSEWYRDPTSGKVSFIPPVGIDPSKHNITAKHRQLAFELASRAYITLNRINIFAATIDSDASTGHLIINAMNARYLTHFMVQPTGHAPNASTGIGLNGANDLIENSRIDGSAGDGVFMGGPNARVTNCVITNTDYSGTDAAPVRVYSTGAQIDHNTIAFAGQNGILIRATGPKILYNTIHDVGLQTTDCGGIYSIRQSGAGGEIACNLIYNVITGGYGGSGVQLDDYSHDFTIDRNVIWNVNDSLKITFDSQNDRIFNNTLDATQFSIMINGTWNWSGSKICNNIFTHTAKFGANAMVTDNLQSTASPMFINKAAANYQLQSASPAIDAGMVMSPFTNGYVGTDPDLGAYEYGAAPFVAGANIS